MKTDGVWSQEGQVENALSGGMFAMTYEREIATLDSFVNKIASEYPGVGKTKEAVEKTDTGYSTSYYYLKFFTDNFYRLNSMYLENQNVSKEQLKTLLLHDKLINSKYGSGSKNNSILVF